MGGSFCESKLYQRFQSFLRGGSGEPIDPTPPRSATDPWYSETCLVHTSKGTQNKYFLSEVFTTSVGYMRYTQGQNEVLEYL